MHNIRDVIFAVTQMLCSESNHLLGGNYAPVQCWLWPNIKLKPKQKMSSFIYDPALMLRPQSYKNDCSTNFVVMVPKKKWCAQKCPV